jgi:PAS domain S-box-containing protein
MTLSSIGDAVISTDMAGHITYLNVVAERLTGWGRQDAAGRPFAEVFHIIDGATRERARNPMTLAAQENRTVGLTANCVLIRRDASELAIDDSTAPIHDRRGLVTGAVIVFHDVSMARARSLDAVHLALRGKESAIVPTSDHAVLFSGRPSVVTSVERSERDSVTASNPDRRSSSDFGSLARL